MGKLLWVKGLGAGVATGLILLLVGIARPQTPGAPPVSDRQLLEELKARIDHLEHQLQEEKEKNQVLPSTILPPALPTGSVPATETSQAEMTQIIDSYLDTHKFDTSANGIVGYDSNRGFFLRTKGDVAGRWGDDVPFQLDIRGRLQGVYEYYGVTDTTNHLTEVNTKVHTAPDFGQGEIKRMRLIFQGIAFDDDLHYRIQFDGNTRGLSGEDPKANFFSSPAGPFEGGQNDTAVDGGVRLLEAWVAYDYHFGQRETHLEDGATEYRPSLRFILGKLKPMGSFEEFLTSQNAQFVEFGMSSWMFDSDADNYLWAAGTQLKAFEDRLFLSTLVTNGADNQVPNPNMDNLPGFNGGFWWDFGGTYNDKTHRWDLYGDGIGDIDYSPNPVLRVGTATNIVPMNRRSQYTTAEMDFYKAASAAPGGTNVDSILNGGGLGTGGTFNTGVASGNSPFAVDAFNAAVVDLYWAAKYRGFSIYNEWWYRNLFDFRGEKFGSTQEPIFYSTTTASGGSTAALFNKASLSDMGMAFQTGYFLIPGKLEIAGRYDLISGDSGDINGDGTFSKVSASSLGIPTSTKATLPAGTIAPTTVEIVNGAFEHYHTSQEITAGVNYYWFRQQVRWQTDIGMYKGGNPAANGSSPAGYIPGVDGWLVRTQIQLYF